MKPTLGVGRLDEADTVRDVKCVLVRRQAHKGLLLAIWANERVDLGGRDVVELLEGALDLALVGSTVNDEDERVVLLDLLHGRLGVEREEDRAERIHARSMRHALARETRVLGQVKRLGTTERGVGAHLAHLGTRRTLQGSLLGSSGLSRLGLVGSGHLDEWNEASADRSRKMMVLKHAEEPDGPLIHRSPAAISRRVQI